MIYRFGGFQVDDEEFRLTADRSTIALEPKALHVLLYLVRNPGRLVRKSEVLEQVWQETSVTESTLTRSIGLLRKALDDDSREPRFIETVPTAGYRFIAEVTTVPAAPSSEVIEGEPEPSVQRSGLQNVRTALPLAVAFAVLVCVLALGWRHQRATAPIRSLAVLPLENLTGDPRREYFADGTTDELTTQLALIPQLRVVSHTSAEQEKGKGDSLEQIARKLNVDAVVEGSVSQSNDLIRINVQLIDARSDRHLWAQSFEEPLGDVLSLQDHVAKEIAVHAKVLIHPGNDTASAHTRTVNPAAYDAYLHGLYFIERRLPQNALSYFQQSIDLDPSYSRAYSGLAAGYESVALLDPASTSEVISKGLAAANRAIALDPANSEAWSVRGSIEHSWQSDWKTAERDLQYAVALNPNDAGAELRYSVLLSLSGRTEQSLPHMRRALDLDPLSFWNTRQLGSELYWSRHYDEALFYLRRAAEMEPTRPGLTDRWMSEAYFQKNLMDEAVEANMRVLATSMPTRSLDLLRSTYVKGGWRAYWSLNLSLTRPFLQQQPCRSFDLAVGYAHLGDSRQTLDILNRLIDQHCYQAEMTKVDPTFDFLHDDPRFTATLKRIHLAD